MNGNQLSNNVSLLLGTVGAVLGIGTIYLQSKRERAAHKAARSQYAQQQPPTTAESPVPEPAHETPKIADSKEAKPAPKPKKRTMEKRVVKPFLPGDSVVFAQHMYDAKAPPLEIRVSNDDLQYNLRPKYLPAKKEGDPPIVYLGARAFLLLFAFAIVFPCVFGSNVVFTIVRVVLRRRRRSWILRASTGQALVALLDSDQRRQMGPGRLRQAQTGRGNATTKH